jgi:hypothetical protein
MRSHADLSQGVSIATMTSFAFNTMIGQVTPIALESIGYRFYIVFVVCNFTNALFFCKTFILLQLIRVLTIVLGAIQPETAKRPLEEMNYLFTNVSLISRGQQSLVLI